jgi:hypothetical protein
MPPPAPHPAHLYKSKFQPEPQRSCLDLRYSTFPYDITNSLVCRTPFGRSSSTLYYALAFSPLFFPPALIRLGGFIDWFKTAFVFYARPPIPKGAQLDLKALQNVGAACHSLIKAHLSTSNAWKRVYFGIQTQINLRPSWEIANRVADYWFRVV